MVFNFRFDLATLSVIAGMLAPVAALWIAATAERRRRRVNNIQMPQKEKLLRPAGYSLSQQIDKLNERLLIFLIASMGFCGIAAAFLPVLTRALAGAAP